MKKYSLSDLDLDEISFVDKGSNEHARVVLFKRQSEPQPTAQSLPHNFNRETRTMSLVAKCSRAVETGDLGNLTKASFDQALEEIAQSYAAEHNLSFAKAYSEILQTPLGSELYRGYEAAPPAPAPVQKAQPDDRPESWKAIEQAAREFRLDNPELSEAAAIAKVLRAEPGLYDDYEAEARAAGRR